MATQIKSKKLTLQRIQMSYQAYQAWAKDDQIMEWANGEGIVYMPPISIHQNI